MPHRGPRLSRLLAAVLLGSLGVFASSGCEEVIGIDFDEYENHTCDDEGDCQACITCGCAEEESACLNSEECGAWVDCSLSCPDGDSACLSGCDSTYPDGQAIFDDYFQCSLDVCPDACGV